MALNIKYTNKKIINKNIQLMGAICGIKKYLLKNNFNSTS